MKIYFDQFLESFGKMGIGMASIIIVIGVLIISVMLLNLFTSKKIKTSRKIIFVSALLVVVIGVSLLNGIRIEQEKEEERIRIEKEVKEYVENNEAKILLYFDDYFIPTGYLAPEKPTEIKAEGENIVIIYTLMQEISDAVNKEELKASYDNGKSDFNLVLAELQKEIKELKSYEFRVCDEKGTVLVSVIADGK